MIGKNNQYLKKTKEGTKVETYSIKKFKVGAASVVIGASIFFGAGAVAQASEDVSKNTTTDNSKDEGVTLGGTASEKVVAKPVVKEATKEEVAAGVAAKLGVKETAKETENEVTKEPVKTLDKTQLSSFISEIEGKISSGAYANKTEESVANLVADLNAAKATLASATTQEELTKAYQKLVVSVNSRLRNKPVEKKETPVVDSTIPKETVSNKAENTEKKVETNSVENTQKRVETKSIENTRAKDPRNEKEIAKNTAFRAAVNQDPKVDFTFSIPAEKKIYIYNEEHFSLEIPVYSETGKIRYATIKQGSRQRFANVAGTENDLDIQYGFTATVINRAETPGVTSDASQANPAKIVITGRPNDALKKHRDYTKQETQTLNIGTRYIQVVDDQGRENLKKGVDITDPGFFYLVLKAQSKKYALRSQPTDEKISVSSLTNPTAEDLKKIKDSIQLEYSTTNEDARFADKRGTLVEHPEDVIQSVNIVGNNIVVTFTDGSTKTKPVGEIVRKNTPPTVNLPYSNEANRNIYIYSGEETDLTFTATDESKIKDLKLRGPGDVNYNNVSSFGLAVGNIADSTVTSGEGSVSEDKKTATIKMTGTTNLRDGQKWTSVIVAKDDNNGESAPFNGRINATTNPAERQKIAGYVEFVVKNQTSKYDIKAPEGKVSVVDPANVTAEEFEKIKEKVKIEYSQTNDDANLTSKRGQAVDNQATRISTITKDANGNLVVTYKDGSTDTKPLSEFTSLNKQPAIDAVNQAAEEKIAEINRNTNATAEEKAAAIQKVNADKTKALTAINDNSVTTKTALDNAKTSGTTAISNDNPVATKKDTAKAAIDTALREKEAAIDANNALTTEEKNAAKADAQAKATAAKTAIDNATTNAAVDSAKTAGTTSVSSVTPTAAAKPAAKNAIDEALKAKEAQLDARADLTEEEKKAAKADAQAKATAAKAAIDNATTNATVDNAKTSGVADVESVNPQASQKKTDAKNAVDEALKAKNDAIDARTDLTAEEKTAAKADAKAKADAAKQAIDNATTNDAVTKAKNDGATSVDSVNPTPVTKPAAKKVIDDALKAKNDAIDARTDLTAEEKAKAKEDAKAKADAAKQAIDNATTNDAVTQAKNDGATSVDSVNPTAQAKPAAKKAIDDALKAKNDAIDANNDLTDEEKTAAKADAKAKADAAKTAIDNATTNAGVEKAKNDGATSVDSVNPTAQAKPAAKKAIEDELKAKNDAIDANNDLTDEEKTAAKADAEAKADAAKTAIDNATTNDAVTKAKNDGATSVDSVNPTAQAKPAAKKAIDDALKAKNDAIDANNDLTAEEKAKAKEDAKAKADAAKQAIDNATTNDAVTQAKNDGATSVDSVNPTAQAKPAAKKAIDDALKAKNDAIDANNDLTTEEKTAAKADAKAKADAAKQAIDNATTNDAVTKAKNDGATSVDSVNPTPVTKPAAKKAIDDALKAKNDAIDANNDLTAEEKAKAKEDAKAKADAAKQAVDNATTNAAVEQAKANGTTSVDSVNPTAQAKPAAKKAIDDALKAKNDAVDANNDLTDEEKTAAKADAKAKADAAKQAIDNATTNDAVTKAKNDGATSVDSVNPTPVTKPAAKKVIDDALKAKNDAIDARTDLTAEEKAKAKEDAKAKADAAKQAIDNATTNDAVTQAKNDGATSVDSVNPTAQAKPAAKKAIDDALKAKNDAIDARADLTDEEKTAAKADAKAKADAAKTAIDNATTNDAVTQAKNDGATSVDSVNPTAQAKPAAKKAIDDALKAKNDAIDANNDLTAEEKTAAKADAKAKADAAKTAIDNATTNDAVTQAKNDGATSVDSVNPTAQAKPAAKKAIDDALKAKNDAIDANNDLTDEEKTAAKADAKAKADVAKQAIDNATTNAGVDQAKANGTTEVNNVNPTPEAKPAAKKAIDDALKAKNDAIDARTDLTDEEKTAAKADAKAKAAAAKQAIDNATTNDAVTQAKNDGATSVDSVNPTPVAKPAAKKVIDDALKAKNDAIDANNDLTAEEKAKAKEDAKAKADAAKQAIDNATTNDAVTQAKNDGATSVDSVNPTAQAKPAAKKAIDDALKAKNDAIDANNDLTDEEKTAAKADAKAKADAAKTAIDNATTNAGVEKAKNDGATSVDSVNPTAQAKPAAKKAIEDALKAKNDAIDANNDLTDEEKTAAKADAKAKADAAKQAIDNATTNDAVTKAKNDGATSVDSVNPTPVAKPAAKKAIDDALKAKNDAIDARTDLTDEEKTAAKADAKEKADAAKQAIDNATTNAVVEKAKNDGATSVDSVNPTPVAKPAAKKAVEDALADKIKEIEANNDLTDEEKATAKQEAQDKAAAAKKAIDNATTNAGVDQAKANGTTEVNKVNPTPVAKPAAKKAIDDALKAKNDAIDANNDLTDEEKTAAKADAKAKADAAKQAIDNATTNAGVDQAKTDGATSVDSVNPTPVAKPAAKKAIDDALKAKNDAIDARTDLTDEEKTAAKADAKAKADAAKQAIDNATTNAGVEKAKNDGAISVDSVNPTAQAKPAAKKAIDDALKAKNDAIDANNDLTDEEKTAAKADAKAKADAAKQAIDNATTNAGVDQAKTDGATEVNNVNPMPVAKPEAKKAIEDALKAKEAEIDSRDDLTSEEKLAAKEEAKAKADVAKQAVDKATTNADVENAKTTGVADVNSLTPVAVKKPEAKKAVDEALKAKEAEIDANNDLTAEEKLTAKEEAKAKADAAKQEIDGADTDIKVDENSILGLSDVNSFSPEPVKKPEAKKAIDKDLEKKIEEIDARDDLTTEEKSAAKAEAENKANQAKEAIDAADTDIKVDENSVSGLSDVNSFSPEAAKKPAAKKAIDDALKAKEDTIDANDNLTAEEKAKAKAEAKAKADAAKEAIDNATTNAEVEQAKTAGTTKIDSVNPTAQAKPAAKKAIDEALKAKNDEIDDRTDLTDEEKTAAKADAKAKADAAKQAIDNATTNVAVEQAKANGTIEVNNVNPTPQAKPAAKKAIDDALKAKNDAIDARTDLTDEEKTAAKDDAKAKADAAKTAIDNATTNEAVEQAKANGTTEVNNVNPTAVVKPEAKKAIDDELKAKNDEIDARTDLTDEEKTAAKDDAKAKADAAKTAIDNATTNEAVEQAKANGTTEVNNVNPTAVVKPEAKKAIDDALKAKNDAINARTDLTDEEKTVAKADAKAKADAAKEAIDNATTNAGVEQAKTDGATSVDSVNPTPVAKPAAKKAVEDALADKIKEIEANNDLTDEEKATAKQEAQDKEAAAKQAIDTATTNAGVEQAKANGTTEVNNVNPTAEAKPAAKKAIDDVLKAKNDEINTRTDLTDEEKMVAKSEAKAKADAAKQAIDNATTNAGVEQAKANGTTEVKAVDPQPVAKTEAKKAIDDALKAKNDEIAARTDLTDEEKAKAKEDVKAKADAAKQAIDKATTNSEVDQAKTAGTAEVKAVDPQPVAKAEAKKAIDETLKAKNDEIDARTDLTDEEKAKAKEDVKTKADAAKQAIDNATTNAEVEQAKTAGTTSVDSVTPLAVKKPEAKKAIDEALKAKTDEIDARTDLTEEEKTAVKAEAKKKADAAKEAIDNATTNAEVEQAKTAGTTSVDSVTPLAVKKPEAKKAIDEALKAKTDEIDARTDLTEEEKTVAKAEAKKKADAAKEAIDNATTNDAVTKAKTDGVTSVDSVNPIAQAKPVAKKAIEDALAEKIKAIEANNDLTDEEKAVAKQEAQDKAAIAKEAIDNATTNAAVDQAKDNGTTEVKAVDPQPVAKPEAKKAVDEALKAKNDEIDARTDLTDEEKIVAKAEAKAKADAAKEGIDIATTNAEIDQIKKNGTTEVNNVNPTPVAKPAAKKAIDDALKAKNDEIDARTDLTDEEKTAAKEEAKAKADVAKEAIDKATTNAEVAQAKANGTTEVASVDPEALVKSVAKKAIEDKLAEQLKVIANTPDATDEEKKAAADLAKQLAEVAKKAIDAARENADVKKLQDNSKVGIEEAVPFVEDKPNARKAIDAEVKVKKAAIDARTDISDKVKELLKAEVDEIAAQAKKAIDAASSVDEINKIEEAKELEIKAVEEVRVPAEKVIVADPTNLTNEEKAKVLAAIKSVNPDVKEITQDAKGNVIVITANGHKQVISVAQVTKTEADLNKENAGNVVNAPVAKTVVADVTKLTEAEKQEIVAKVKAVNPGTTVAIDEKGNVIVTNGEGLVFVLPVLDLVIPTDKLTDITANSKVNTPAIRTLVANKGSLTQEEIAKIKAAIEEINPGAIVVVDAKGNATVTTKDGKSMTISSDVLVKDAADVAVKNNGENINLDFDKEIVADINNLTESDKEKVKFKVLGAIREAVELVVDAKGNVAVILKDGRTFTILAKDIFEQRKEVTVNLPEKIKVKDVSNLTETEKEAVKQALITANPNLKDAKITISSTGEVTIVYPDGQVVVISAKNLVVTEKATDVIVEDNVGNYAKEDKKSAVDYSNNNTQKFNAKKDQRLANTGTTETNTGLAGLGMAILGGLLAVAKRRKKKEE